MMNLIRRWSVLVLVLLVAVVGATSALADACDMARFFDGHSLYYNVACFWDWFMDLPMI